MTIDDAIRKVQGLIDYASDENVSQYYLGDYVWDVFDALEFVVDHVKTTEEAA